MIQQVFKIYNSPFTWIYLVVLSSGYIGVDKNITIYICLFIRCDIHTNPQFKIMDFIDGVPHRIDNSLHNYLEAFVDGEPEYNYDGDLELVDAEEVRKLLVPMGIDIDKMAEYYGN